MTGAGTARRLDPTRQNLLSTTLLDKFKGKVVSQEKAVQALVDMVEKHAAGFGDSRKPIGSALFLGPTGVGKTHVVETLAVALYGDARACLRIDCAEFQHSHEIAKLIGSPPGYLGHRETHPALTQEALNQWHTLTTKISIVLFDEIEKASDSLWDLLLGILDKASLTLGDNRKVDFSNTIVVMTSNLGAKEMFSKSLGFVEPSEGYDAARLERVALSAAKSKFRPEFMNRIQHTVTFQSLNREQIDLILEMELKALQFSLDKKAFVVLVSPNAKKRLAEEGFDKTYGARPLKRTIERLIEGPITKLYTSGQIVANDIIIVNGTPEGPFEFFSRNFEPKVTTV